MASQLRINLISMDVYICFFVTGMFITGIFNSIVVKWQDMQCVKNCDAESTEAPVFYSQPVWQTLQMFIGESFCLLVYVVRSITQAYQDAKVSEECQSLLSHWQVRVYGSMETAQHPTIPSYPWYKRSFKFFLPATFDIISSTLMNLALLIMPVSIFQMTRGALVLWVGLLSGLFLRRYLPLYQWLSLVLVMLGIVTVGLSSLLVSVNASQIITSAMSTTPNSAIKTLLGLMVVFGAQIFSALQFVWEEKLMEDYLVEPLLIVGLEGIFGIFQVLILMWLLHFFIGSTPQGRSGIFDMREAWHQTMGIKNVRISAFGCAISIALFNVFGMTVTKYLSATTRSTIDTFRTLGICVVSVALGWEVLYPVSGTVQALGFAILAYGTFMFNGVISPPHFLQRKQIITNYDDM